jgi:hypothetical protein
MIIRYVEGTVTVFEVNGELFYFNDNSNMPEMFDSQLKKMTVPNFDNWIQAKTDQRYSLRGLRDMSVAFRAGFDCSISDADAHSLVIGTVAETKRLIFHTDLATGYGRAYFIELMDPPKIEEVHVKSIVANFDKLLKACGRGKLYNYLCRFWQICNYSLPNASAVFEGFIARLKLQPSSPQYPKTSDLDNELTERVSRIVFKDVSLCHVTDEVISNARRIQSKRI